MAANELVIKINGDVKNYKKALEDAKKQTEDLSEGLNSAAKISAVAFAALTAEITLSVMAFAESEAASNKLTNALQNQGIYSKELLDSYKKMADAISEKTGVSDEELVAAQGTLQVYLGQTKVTQDLTQAITDLSVAKGMDLTQASNLVGKAIAGNTEMLKRYGIEMTDTGTKTGNLAKITEELTKKYGGAAEAAAQGLGVFTLVKRNFGELQEAIGEKFAPIFVTVGRRLNEFLLYLKDPAISDFIVKAITFGTVFTGIATVVATAGVAFLSITALLTAAGVAASSLVIPLGLLAAGVGALSLSASDLATNWKEKWPEIQAYFSASIKRMATELKGMEEMMRGFLDFDWGRIKEGWNTLITAGEEGAEEYNKVLAEKKQEQIDIEEKLEQDRRNRNVEQKATWTEEDKILRQEAAEGLLAQNAEFQAMDEEQKAAYREQNMANLMASQLTVRNAELQVADEKAKDQQKHYNQLLTDTVKYGETYAKINAVIGSERMNKARELSGQMVALTQSENQTLKGIGKAAAIANISMDTARGAMAAYARSIEAFGPIFGPIIGTILAGAVVAFGAEQLGKVTAAADGGLITGGTPGRDSVPAMLMPGELVVPTRNYEEVVSAVADSRSGTGGTAAGGEVVARVVLELKDNLMEFIEAKLVERDRLGISLQGA